MLRENISDLLSFLAVARERSFTRAAGKLGVSPSALSHTVRGLEARMGVRLLHRTTRSVSPTEAGERLLQTVAPRLEEIEAELHALAELRDTPAGTVRITSIDWVAETLLWPRLRPLLLEHPGIHVEISSSYKLEDIVAERFDLGVRSGSQVDQDMVAVRISPDFRRMVVGSRAYFERHPMPQHPSELSGHRCIALRLSTQGGLFAWPLQRGDEEVQVRVDAQLVFNNSRHVLQAALDGCGLALTSEPLAAAHLAAGRLVPVLSEWHPLAAGFHVYYPSRRQPSRAFSLVVDALRHREDAA